MSGIEISLCICRQVEFQTLLPLARQHGWAVSDVARETGCGGQCGLCRPYLRRMLETGETTFHEIITE